uniref:Uncharacterized protein n=1 Tax=Bicosoecida sp. CB-2014 TaxID=1486930 RepID=A0A7S1CK98_9STRA
MLAAGVDADVAAAVLDGLFRDVAVQAHAGTPVPREEAARSIRHSDTIMSLLHLAVSLRGRRGVLFETYASADDEDGGRRGARAAVVHHDLQRVACAAGGAYLTCPTAAFHYPYFPHEELVLAVQFRILCPAAEPLCRLYRDGSYRRGLSAMGRAALAAVADATATQAWRLPSLREVVAEHAALFGE